MGLPARPTPEAATIGLCIEDMAIFGKSKQVFAGKKIYGTHTFVP
jgi:hypothetical protein